MSHTDRDRALALSALFQAVAAVQQIARRGAAEASDLEVLLFSLFQTDPPSVEAVFGETARLASGARVLVAQLEGGVRRNLQLTRYVIQVLQLQLKLSRDPAMLDRVAAGLAEAEGRLREAPLLDPGLLAQLAELYSRTLSRLRPRIIVHGDPRQLQNPANVHRIRALLLAAVRAAVLWRQCGGSTWQILLGRRRLLAQARVLAGG